MVTVHGAVGDCPVSRPESQPLGSEAGREHGTVPLGSPEGDSPIFAAFAFFGMSQLPRRENWDSPL